MAAAINNRFSFGEFELDADRRVLLRRGETVPLKSKSLDLLIALIEKRGEVVSKNALLDVVWENQFVEENNLTVHVAALRKALGETKNENRYIVTVPGKGYRFVAPVFHAVDEEVVVERHSVERIVINEEIFEAPDRSSIHYGNGGVLHQAASAPDDALVAYLGGRVQARRLALLGTAIAALVLIGGIGYSLRDRLSAVFASTKPFIDHRVRQLTTNGKVGLAALSPDGKMFAFTIDDIGQKSLWVGYVDGGDHLQLRQPADGNYGSLGFSPDGTKLYFSIRDDKNPKSALYAIPVLGGVPVKVLDEISDFALSPDGRQIAIGRSDGGNVILEIVSIDGGVRREVASFPKDRWFFLSSPSWSSDGARLAFSSNRLNRTNYNDLVVVDIATGDMTRFTLPDLREITKTAWLADGSGLILTAIEEGSHSSVPQYRLVHVTYPKGVPTVITADRSNYGASWHNDAGPTLALSTGSDLMLAVEHRQLSNVWVAPADDLGAARQITFSSFGRYDGLWGLDWAPDGSIIYTTSDTSNQYLSRMNADGSGQNALTSPIDNRGQVDSVLTVSADGQYIFFHSNRTNFEMDIWRADIDGTNSKQLTFGGKAFHPAPSPDGKWVYYKSFLDGIGALCRVPIDGGDPQYVTDKETSWMSFSPDGKFIAASYVTDKRRLAIISSETHEVVKQFELPGTGTLYMGSRWTPDSKSVTYRDHSYGYWIQDIEGGEPYRLEGLPKEKFYNFSWSRDGKWFAFVRGQEIRDVVLFQRGE